MILHATVNQDGLLKAELPQALWGEKVIVSIIKEIDYESANWNKIPAGLETVDEIDSESSNWDQISEILAKADTLDFPRRTHEEILAELRAFRETE
jgi:hypothetical protein